MGPQRSLRGSGCPSLGAVVSWDWESEGLGGGLPGVEPAGAAGPAPRLPVLTYHSLFPLSVWQAQAVTLTVAQAFKVAFEFWQVSKEGEYVS